MIIPASPFLFTPGSTTMYKLPYLNKEVKGLYITSETSIKVLLL